MRIVNISQSSEMSSRLRHHVAQLHFIHPNEVIREIVEAALIQEGVRDHGCIEFI